MKVAVLNGRVQLVVGDSMVDVETASGGALSAEPGQMFHLWPALRELAVAVEREMPRGAVALDQTALDMPIPRPTQAFGIGLNYRDHAGESEMTLPDTPLVFPKFSSCIAGPNEPVATRSRAFDWEAELVVVIGAEGYEVPAQEALSMVAGYTVGQDLTDRAVQFEGGANPQFGLGKSGPGFGPIGPWIVSVDELGPEPQLDIRCEVDGVVKQSSNTRHLIFGVPTLLAYLSARVRLLPGDLIFTGTPAGVGWMRNPRETLGPARRIDTTIEGIGTLTTRLVNR